MRMEIKTHRGSPPENDRYTVVYIDYESLYYSFIQQFSVPPDLNGILSDLKKYGKIIKIKAFGDFSKNGMQQERNRIRTITSEIIDCARGDDRIQKDYTDFIILDHIYQEAIQNPAAQQFILFTGDGHFSSAATFLRTYMDKEVGVYGIRKTLSNQLVDCSSWTRIIEVYDADEEKYIMNLINNFKAAKDRGIIMTFLKTIEYASEHYGGEVMKYQDALSKMIDGGYVETYMATGISGKNPFRAINPDWEKLEKLQTSILEANRKR